MDNNDSPAAGAERTFWTVWYYITGAVNRFFRSEPANIISNDPNPLQESTADSEPANCGHAEGDRSGGGVNEEHPLAIASLISSSQPLVAWEHCTTEIDLRPDEEGVQHKTQLGSENTASEEGEGMREEQSAQTGGDDARPLVDKDAKTDEQEESGGQELCARGRNEMPVSDEYEEGLNTSSQRLAGDAMSEDMEESGRKASAEDETEGATTPDDLKEMDETTAKVQVVEEDDEMHREDKRDVETEDTEVKPCTITDLSLEEEDNKRAEEERVQTADIAVMHEEVENGDSVLLLASENENKSVEEARQVENQFSAAEELPGDNRDLRGDQDFDSLHELQMSHNKIVSVFKDDPVVAVQEHVTAHGSESDKDEDLKEQEGERTLDEREQDAVIEEEDGNEATNNRTIDEELQLEDTKAVAEDSQEEDVLNGHAVCSEEAAQAAARTWHAVEFRDGEQEDVAKDTKVETKRREADDVETESTVIDKKYDAMTTHISGDEAEEERLSSEVDNEEGYMEVACPAISVTVKPQGETGQEISGEFKNVSTGTSEGRLVVSWELNSPTCEETQEGVPEYNNEPGEPDGNTTQRFLEVGDCEEILTTQLPEEVENEDPESLQNSGCSTGAYSFVRERMEEEQDSTDHIQNSFSLVVEEHAGIGHLTTPSQVTEKPLATVIEESEFLLKEEEGKLLSDSMKTGFEDSEKEFETHTGLADETAKATKEQQDETQELLVEFEKDEEFCDSKEADATGDSREATENEAEEVQKMTDTSFLQELVDTIQSEQNSNRTPSLVDISEFGLMKQSDDTEPILLEKGAVEMQDAGIDMEETGYGVEEEAETQIKNEMELVNLQVVAMAAELTTEKNEKENTLIAELSETLKTETLLSDEALETSDEEMFTETEAADGSMTTESRLECLAVISQIETTKHVTESEGSNAEETVGSISGHQDVIDEDILDWWIQTASSEDADGMKQQEGLEQQMDTEIESSSEEQHDLSAVQTEKDKEQTVEANSGESEVVIDTEISSSTAESGFSDQSLSEWGTQNSEAQQLKSISTGSPQGIYDMPADMSESADISEVSKQQSNSGLQDILMEETAEMEESYLKEEESITETGFPPYSGAVTSEVRHLNQESDRSLEKTDEDTGPQLTDLTGKSDRNDAKQADVNSVTGTSTSFKVEETEVENEPFEITAPEAVRSRSSSEVSSEGRGASTESNSDGNACTESERRSPSLDKPQPEWSEDVAESLPGPHAAEVAEQLAAIYEDEMEVDASALDFTAQRSRIAVKNPRVRPPKDPRSLLHMPSLDPTPSTQTPAKVPAGVPLGALGIGIKLPGLGAGFPVLKKTPRAVRDENSQENVSREPETKPEEKSDTPKQDEAQHKPKWMPPRHPGFGNPLMSELKTKLKKTTKE